MSTKLRRGIYILIHAPGLPMPAGAGPVPGGMLRFLVIFSLTTNQDPNWTKARHAVV